MTLDGLAMHVEIANLMFDGDATFESGHSGAGEWAEDAGPSLFDDGGGSKYLVEFGESCWGTGDATVEDNAAIDGVGLCTIDDSIHGTAFGHCVQNEYDNSEPHKIHMSDTMKWLAQ